MDLRIIIFGATGMIGSGVLQSCFADPDVKSVLAVSRSPSGLNNPKLHEIIHSNFFDYSAIEDKLKGYNACLFVLGVSSAGMNESDYSQTTYELTIAAASTLIRLNPGMSFGYVSGQGTDSTEKGSFMWARVKGRTENKLLAMGFKPATMFRPGAVRPLKGVRSKTRLYRVMYYLLGPLLTLLLPISPGMVTTSERLGQAMLKAAKGEAGKSILESRDINALGE